MQNLHSRVTNSLVPGDLVSTQAPHLARTETVPSEGYLRPCASHGSGARLLLERREPGEDPGTSFWKRSIVAGYKHG